jgi:hypothetical protein
MESKNIDFEFMDNKLKDYEEVAKIKAVALAKQHAYIDRELEIWGIRSRTVLEIRNQKEVKVKL